MTPGEARDALDQADAARRHMSEALRLPSSFHLSIGVAIAVQVGTLAVALTAGWSSAAAIATAWSGILVFLVVAGVQLWRFRRLNGAWVRALASRAVLGTSTLSSLGYAAGLALAVWAGFAELWWLLVLASIAAGVAYAWAGRHWWASYRRDPRGDGESRATLIAWVVVAAGALVLVVVGR